MHSFFRDSPEFEQRKRRPYSPPKVTLAQVRSAIPKHLFEKNTAKGCFYVARDIVCAVVVYKLGWAIDPFASTFGIVSVAVKWFLWVVYWYAQGIILTGWWCMAHEAGHGTLSNQNWINHVVGFLMHTFLLTPFYAWRVSHHAHHKATMSVERDENYVPRTRKDCGLPDELAAKLSDYHEIFEDAPIYTLLRIAVMQVFGWPMYLFTNAMGSPRHPPYTNHFLPWSSIFKPQHCNYILISDAAIGAMGYVLYLWTCQVGFAYFVKLYLIPFLCVNHWIVMLTYLHHCDPTVPYFRRKQWSFLRGASSTVDRPFLGWAGRFFLHNVSHDHLSHHLFSSIPFYNQPLVTEHIKKVLKENYNYDSTNSFRALYRTFTECCFIEDDGDIVFYKNKNGKTARVLADDALDAPSLH
ncbi:delta-12 fatty acid desaturase [Roridomyces roridus]|uniref:Delta-12 fatty acid desaturase n=1 Tax=Roridomyces roridus TaxID=1738132 RepID=A0AAD7BJY1_9AGAR|nr:delta-12 fatty acid desaturase [Roridomyces roridus]